MCCWRSTDLTENRITFPASVGGRNARYAGSFEVGAHCAVWGRIQSREYMKKLSEDQLEKRIAYEVSVSKLERMD